MDNRGMEILILPLNVKLSIKPNVFSYRSRFIRFLTAEAISPFCLVEKNKKQTVNAMRLRCCARLGINILLKSVLKHREPLKSLAC